MNSVLDTYFSYFNFEVWKSSEVQTLSKSGKFQDVFILLILPSIHWDF